MLDKYCQNCGNKSGHAWIFRRACKKLKLLASNENARNIFGLLSSITGPDIREDYNGSLLIKEMHNLGAYTIIATIPLPIRTALAISSKQAESLVITAIFEVLGMVH